MASDARVILFPVHDNPTSDAALQWYLDNVHKAGDFVQLLHVVDKSEKFIDELLHTDIRLKCAAVNDPAVDFVFERFAPKLAAANIEHRINVLRCSQAARTVGDVITSNAARIKASMVIMSMRDKSRLAEALLGSCCNHVMHKSPVPVIVVRGSATAVTAAAPVAVAAAAPVAPAAAAAVPEN